MLLYKQYYLTDIFCLKTTYGQFSGTDEFIIAARHDGKVNKKKYMFYKIITGNSKNSLVTLRELSQNKFGFKMIKPFEYSYLEIDQSLSSKLLVPYNRKDFFDKTKVDII